MANSKTNTDILSFIKNFNDKSPDLIKVFSNGYCLHFAYILEKMYPGGTISWVCPYAHIVYVLNNIPYDISGTYCGESKTFIPIQYLNENLSDFEHIPGKFTKTSKTDVANIIKNYYKTNHKKGLSEMLTKYRDNVS